MKKFLLMAAVALFTVSANAQQPVGSLTLRPEVGMTISKIGGDVDTDSKVGLVAGAELQYQFTDRFALTGGALYSMEGGKKGDLKLNLDYINVPILANYYVYGGLALKAGVQFGFNVRSEYKGETTILGHTIKSDGGLDAKTLNMSIPVGLSYEYHDFVLDARYNIGLTDIFDDIKGKSSVWQITIGYKFAL